MVSNTHEYDQIVVSKEITQASSSKNTYGLNKSDITETFFSKNREQLKSYVQPDGNNVENKRVVEVIILDDNKKSSHIEGDVIICDTCGDLGYEDSLVICCNCEVGAEHTYCMMEKVDKNPDNWSCYNCTKEVDGMQKEEKNEETSSIKRKAKSVVNSFEIAEKRSPQRRYDLLNTQSYRKIADFDLNVDPNIELGDVSGIDVNKNLVIDLNEDHGIDQNKDHGINLNMDPNIDMNMGHNMGMSLVHASSFEVGSSSNFQAQWAKRHRVDTKLSI